MSGAGGPSPSEPPPHADTPGRTGPRVAPVERESADALQAELLDSLGPAGALNLFRTLARHPKLMRSWLPFGGRLLQRSTLPPRDRELVILRTAARCGSDYEWGQHVDIARVADLTDEEILRVASGPDAAGWSTFEAALLRSVDELVDGHVVSEATWEALAGAYDDASMIELTMLVGHYAMLAGMLRSAGVPTEVPLPRVGEV